MYAKTKLGKKKCKKNNKNCVIIYYIYLNVDFLIGLIGNAIVVSLNISKPARLIHKPVLSHAIDANNKGSTD